MEASSRMAIFSIREAKGGSIRMTTLRMAEARKWQLSSGNFKSGKSVSDRGKRWHFFMAMAEKRQF